MRCWYLQIAVIPSAANTKSAAIAQGRGDFPNNSSLTPSTQKNAKSHLHGTIADT